MPTDANWCQLMPMPTGNLLEAAGNLLGISGHAMCWEKQSILALAISRSIWRRTSSSGFSLGMNLVRVLLVRWRTCKLLPSSEISSSDHPHSLGAMIDELVLTINVDNYWIYFDQRIHVCTAVDMRGLRGTRYESQWESLGVSQCNMLQCNSLHPASTRFRQSRSSSQRPTSVPDSLHPPWLQRRKPKGETKTIMNWPKAL